MFKPTQQTVEDQEARRIALERAVHIASVTGEGIAEEIVADAEKFAAFLLGTKPPARKRGRPPKKRGRGRPPKAKA